MSYRALFTSIVSLTLVFLLNDFSGFEFSVLYRITSGSIFGVIGLFCMLSVVKKASLQWLGIYNLLGILITSFYLWAIEDIDFKKSLLGMFLIILGFLFFIYSNKDRNKINIYQHLLLLLMTISFNLSSLIHWKNLTKDISPMIIISNQEFVVFIAALIMLFYGKKNILIVKKSKENFFKVLTMSSIILLALLFSFMGLKITNPIISSVLFLATPLTTIIFSTIYFKEKLTGKNFLAILIISLGAFILNFISN
jgi:hypothetical protein